MSVPSLYIGSTTNCAGKTTLNAGIGLRLQKEGLNLAFMKPVGQTPFMHDGQNGDEDAAYVQDILNLNNPLDLITPVLITQDFKVKAFNGQVDNREILLGKIREAKETLSLDKNLLLMGGTGNMFSNRYCGLDAITLINELDLKTIVIDRISQEVNYDTLIMLKDCLGDHLLGVVLNDVPQSFMSEAENIFVPFLQRNKIKVFGILPQDPIMGAIRIGVIAEGLGGRIVAAQHNSGRMVESFLIGTMQVDNFMTYFKRSAKQAVIVGGDRADVQLVAIEGECSCLILTGNIYPNDIILSRAETLNIPVMIVRDDTYTVAKRMERMLSRYRLRDAIKIRRASLMVSENIDFPALRRALQV
jgi:BioD-like phosphotransacetylase family protein